MNEWDVVGALVILVGLFFTVGKPIITLNTSITILNERLRETREDQLKHEKYSAEEHKRIWDHNKEQDETLSEHAMRLHDLDGK